ncbi:MAG TPA: DUF3795 domain-containing protein [Dehalococcoidia bacterium]|nr:DUF3795 domain-containing protein [Dehalococcoidia bacterium]
MPKKNPAKPDKRLTAVCGLFCPSCAIFIATHEDPKKLKLISENRKVTVEEAKCDGCRAQRRNSYCKTCKMYLCATKKGIDFCGQCEDYPCGDLKEFQAEYPHRFELWQAQERIKKVGYEQWYKEQLKHYSCPKCHTLNSAYDFTCRKCGASPSCAYNKLHEQETIRMLSNMKL